MMKKGTYSILLFIVYEGGDGLTLVGMEPGLSMNLNGSAAYPQMVDRARDDARRSGAVIRRHE